MNLNRLLAENMVRFGTKNLSSSTLRTLLNEGSKAGDAPSQYPSLRTLNEFTANNATIGQWIQPYDKPTEQILYLPNKSLIAPAATALAAATVAAVGANKKLIDKSIAKADIATIYDGLAGVGGIGTYLNVAESLTGTITYAKTTVEVYPSPTKPNAVATIGNIDSEGGTVQNQGLERSTAYFKLLGYMNYFNIGNLHYDGDFTQYDLLTMVDKTTRYVNLLSTSTQTNKLIVYGAATKAPNVADKEITSTTVGASGPVPKQYDVSFDTGVSTIPANDTEVARAVQDAIAMFPDGNITNLTVVSSASPEFNDAAGGPKTLADYGQTPTSGTGDPGAGTTDIAKNIKLAYDRGVSFMTALNAGLAAAGKPQVTNYTVNWQISDKGGKKVPGRYAEVQWEKAGNKGKEQIGMNDTGETGATKNLAQTFTVNRHEFSWGTTAAAASAPKK